MGLYLKIIILVFYITLSQQSIYNEIKDNVLSFFNKDTRNNLDKEPRRVKFGYNKFDDRGERHQSIYNDIKDNVLSFIQRSIDNNTSKKLTKVIKPVGFGISKFARSKSKDSKDVKKMNIDHRKFPDSKTVTTKTKRHFHIEPVLNNLRTSAGRRYNKDKSSSGSSSSSLEMRDWKDEWREHWIKKKMEAINSSRPRGDVVNMVAARPWGVPCGDPNQHDMPWGSCMLPMECDAEYRIYRGDYFCGRTQFVCCALELHTYDMYQGFDVSFADSSLSTDSEERKNRNRGSKERRRRKRRKERKKRRRQRQKRKRKIKKNIRKIIREIRKILNRSYRNGTTQRKRKTKQLKKFIKDLKRQYRKDRQSVKTIHETDMIKIDTALQQKLNQLMSMNRDFIRNSTFRNIVVNGTINKQGARMLVQAYPELSSYIDARRTGDVDEPQDYLEYDIEYGLLYY
ncbi:hypothetical protein K1T71_010630 [Dendrolimus kikuchii]|uniref:Uncharacterized protein n=1 Tax=Dendrolimus kikuchii TaxID=765133 RepID=A0ACC1CPT4_9NEOP|nr:hypothetical protein K1T71_010630 [Dendrolimus kikuchii]